MDIIFILIGCATLFVLGVSVGWTVRDCKIQNNADGFLRCIVDEKDCTYYPMLDLNRSMPEILEKPYAVFIVQEQKSQK